MTSRPAGRRTGKVEYLSVSMMIALLLAALCPAATMARDVPDRATFEPDEGGYAADYTPAKKLGKVDLRSTATNEPFRHLIWGSAVPWDTTSDFRDFGFKAVWNTAAWKDKPADCCYMDLNEAQFRAGNPIYEPDPKRAGAGETFKGVNGPLASVTISNINEDSRWNPFLLTEQKIDEIARSIANPSIGFLRWDIESFNIESWDSIIKGRQTWEGGKYRHKSNGGTDPKFKDMDDPAFYNLVQDRWSYVYSELFYKTKLHCGGKTKLWMYGMGPVGKLAPPVHDQFNQKGELSGHWQSAKSVWRITNSVNHKSVAETLDYMEPWDMIPTDGMFGIALRPDPAQPGWWYSTDIIMLKKPAQKKVTKGPPTRFSVTEIGPADNGMRRVKISLHAQDGTLRPADKEYGAFFQDWHGSITATIPKGQHSAEMVVHPSGPYVEQEDGLLMLAWNNMYCQRYHEPKKLGFMNWEPTHRTEGLFTTDLFEQRVYDAMVAFANLQNYGIVYWDANTVGHVNAMVRECLIQANKKIAPYKSHIENQVLCQTGVSLDDGKTWVEPGYPTKPFEQCYNGWWMQQQQQAKKQYPMLLATYNAKQHTVLVAHLTNRTEGTLKYKIKVKTPNGRTKTLDMTSDKNLQYTLIKMKK